MRNFPGTWYKLRQKSEFFTHFQKSLEEKDLNIHLNDKFPLKLANIPLQKQNFPGMRFPNSAFFPCMVLIFNFVSYQ